MPCLPATNAIENQLPSSGSGTFAVTSPFVDSTFTVTLFDDNVAQDSFTFNAPNDTLAFVGVTAEFDLIA